MTDEQLSALLRLKRYEQPPAGYFDKLLTDIHRRQRAELLRRPLWKIVLDRIQSFFGERSLGNLAYGGAMAAVAALRSSVSWACSRRENGERSHRIRLGRSQNAQLAPVSTR
jgi:hypothetical protein